VSGIIVGSISERKMKAFVFCLTLNLFPLYISYSLWSRIFPSNLGKIISETTIKKNQRHSKEIVQIFDF